MGLKIKKEEQRSSKGMTKGQRDTKLLFQQRVRDYNFLKWWRVVRYWAKRKYGISNEDLEVLLYLYDEGVFTRKEFKKFEGILSWDRNRLNELMDRGYIVLWRDHKGYKKYGKRYTLSAHAKMIVNTTYKKLTQEEHIPENHYNNPIFKGDGYMDKKYRSIIKLMNSKRDAEDE